MTNVITQCDCGQLPALEPTYRVATATGVSRPAFSPSGQLWEWTPQSSADYGSLADAIAEAEAIPAADGLLVQLCRYPAPDPQTAPCIAQRIGRNPWRGAGRERASLSELLGCDACSAEPGEECRPMCIGQAAHLDEIAPTCDECGARTDQLVSDEHDESCSLYPANVTGGA